MNILAISGSIRAGSSNTAIIKAIQSIAPADVHITLYEALSTIPHFDPGIAADQSPESVIALRQQIQHADAVIICTPEYAFGIPGILKNALDWLVSSGEMNTKPVAAISASPLPSGGKHAHDALMLTLKALGTRVAEKCQLQIGGIYTKMNPQKEVTDAATLSQLSPLLHELTIVANTPVTY